MLLCPVRYRAPISLQNMETFGARAVTEIWWKVSVASQFINGLEIPAERAWKYCQRFFLIT